MEGVTAGEKVAYVTQDTLLFSALNTNMLESFRPSNETFHCLQALITPLVGVAGNTFNRMHLIAGGTTLSAVMYIGLGSATSGAQVADPALPSALLVWPDWT